MLKSIIIDWEKQKKDIFEMQNISKRRNLLSKEIKQKAYENKIRVHNWFLEQRDLEKIVRPIDIIDGCHKINRLKCMFADISVQKNEIGNIKIGCNKTPYRGKYLNRIMKLIF
jgi:hypothetical protein